MKKLLFVLMLAVMGNTFAVPRSQKAKSTRAVTTSRISESDRKEIENVIQRDMTPIFNKLLSIGINDYKKEIEKDTSLFEKGFVISEPLKKEILKGVEQYLWLHRRFKTRPTEDEPSLYS